MSMAVMQVGIVGMLVAHWQMFVPMVVRLPRRVIESVAMLMMRIVNMAMLMVRGLMKMFMLMALCQVQIEAEAH